MARFLITWLLLVFFKDVAALWPMPQSLSTGSTALRLSPAFSISIAVKNPPQDLQDAVKRIKGFITKDNLQALVPDRGASSLTSVKKAKQLKTLTLSLTGHGPFNSISEEAVADLTVRQESYNLHVPADGSTATLSANSTLGLLRGLTTFSQLWYSLDNMLYTPEAPISIQDKPAYPYRGFMLDTARNYFPVSSILSTLDSLSLVKINTFHWHIVDSQSFPLQLKNFPELSSAGAYSSSFVYSESDIQNVVSYAAARGIDVMLEIDTPGHTSVIGDSHPDFVACKDMQPWSQFANEPPAGQLRLTEPEVISFVSSLFTSTAKLSPSKLFSSGGDEINANCYAQDGPTQAALNKSGQTFEEALSSFTQQTHATLEKLGKTPVVWEEMVLAHNVTLSPSTIALVWISAADAQAVTAKGYRIIHASSDSFYLDCGAGGWVGNNVNGNSWCDPFKTWQKAYSFDPLANISASQQHLVLGGQQLLWTEQSGPQNLDSIVWPRAAASAEVFWTGGDLNGTSALPRLHDLRYRLVQRGVNAINLQPEWCALRPHACDLPLDPVPASSEDVELRPYHSQNGKDDGQCQHQNNRNEDNGVSKSEQPEQQNEYEPFSLFFRNHIRKKMEHFFGSNPHGAADMTNGIVSEESGLKRRYGYQLERNHGKITEKKNHDRHVTNGAEKEKQKGEGEDHDNLKYDSDVNVHWDSFGSFFREHIRKRIVDHVQVGPAAPREANEL